MRKYNLLLLSLFFIVVFLLLLPETAMAQVDLRDSGGTFDGLLELIQQRSGVWDTKLRIYATRIFWLLASIQFIWTFFPLLFKQADFGEIIGELIRFILVTGFFLSLLTFSTEWCTAIVDSFREAAGQASGYGEKIRPSDVFVLAIQLGDVINNVDGWLPQLSFMVTLCGLIVLLCFAFIAVFMALTIIESYIVINASVLFMGFGGSQWTREYALITMRYAVSVGAKLFILTLLIGLIVDSAKEWEQAYQNNQASMLTMVGLSLACAYFTKTIPELISGLIAGSSPGGGSSIGNMASAIASGITAAAATIATAGTAAPAIGGATVSTTGSGATSSGLANLINSSMGASSQASSATTTASTTSVGNTIGGATNTLSTGGQTDKAVSKAKIDTPQTNNNNDQQNAQKTDKTAESTSEAKADTPQTSNNDQQNAQETDKTAESTSEAKADTPQTSNIDQQNAQETDKTAESTSEAKVDTPQTNNSDQQNVQKTDKTAKKQKKGGNTAQAAHMIASALVRGTGILAAMSVPGMESSASLSLGIPPPPPDSNASGEQPESRSDMESDEVKNNDAENMENVIYPSNSVTTKEQEGSDK